VIALGVATCLGVKLYREYQSMKRSVRVTHGFDSEVAIARNLKRSGAEVELSPGSRGAFDILADWSDDRWAIQAKASRTGEPRGPGPAERRRLVEESGKIGARPVIALRRGTRTTYHDAVSYERVYPSGRARR
jgi:hypothetical protein